MASQLTIEGLHQVALTTTDLERSCEFYRETLGLKQIAIFEPPGLAFFDAAGVRLSLQFNADAKPANSVIYFRVADIDVGVAALSQKSVQLEQEPQLVFKDDQGQFGDAGEEEWMAFFRDPDGNLLALACRKES